MNLIKSTYNSLMNRAKAVDVLLVEKKNSEEANYHLTKPSDLEDPFSRECITGAHLFMHDRKRFTGAIEFKKNKTKGRQDFEGHSFEEILVEMGEFLKQL